MDSKNFSISEVVLMLDIMKEDRVRWLSYGKHQDVTECYDSIISKLESRLEEYHGIGRAIESLRKTTQ